MLCVFGGAHVDVIAKVGDHFAPGTSCPGIIRMRFGGVGRNVACLMASTGCDVHFHGRTGADADGSALRSDLMRRGVTVSGLLVDDGQSTGRYVAIHDESGRMVAAVSDLSIYDRMSLADLPSDLAAFRLVFADCNMPPELLSELAERCPDRLVIDAISAAKVGRLKVAMAKGALVMVNRSTAASFLGQDFPDAPAAATALGQLGCQRAVVTDGGRTLAFINHGNLKTVAIEPVPMEDETGAGDALTAGMLTGLYAGLTLEASVHFGIRVAACALKTRGALDAIPAELLAEAGLAGGCG